MIDVLDILGPCMPFSLAATVTGGPGFPDFKGRIRRRRKIPKAEPEPDVVAWEDTEGARRQRAVDLALGLMGVR